SDEGSASADREGRIRFGKTWLDLEAAKLFDEEGASLPLTSMEFNLLKLFALNRGRVLNRDQILEGAHDRSWDPFDRSIDIRISRIRKKIEPNPTKPVTIRTVRGIGYIFDPDAS
ncbi:MAG: winged helix-turn-helix domain-containing protein, partial [Erythrobacter sp.]